MTTRTSEPRVMANDPAYEYRRAEDAGAYTALPDGWAVAVWPDGRALICTPRTCPQELGGHAVACATLEDALAQIPALLRAMSEEVDE